MIKSKIHGNGLPLAQLATPVKRLSVYARILPYTVGVGIFA
ncbi:MAG TPA: hypothetical protein VKV79_02905 [Terriglobia bacterium]|nr:hypothetical protein [Terriglobia bacterium]